MDHPIKHLILDLLDADLRRDRLRFAECKQFLLERGWLVDRVEPPKPVREPQAPPPPIIGPESPAQEAARMASRPTGFRGAGNS